MESNTALGFERVAIVVCGLVPLAGLVFFGWSVTEVIYLLWLDAYLSSFRMIPANLYLIQKYREYDPLDSRNPLLDRIGNLGLAAVMWMFLALPVMIAGKFLDVLVAQFHPGGFESVAYDLFFDAPWSIALLAGSRVFQCVREFAAARAAGPSRFAEMIKVLYGLLFCKGVVLFAFASWTLLFGLAGFKGEVTLVATIIIGLVAFEWYADRWFHPAPRLDAIAPAKKPLEIVHGFDGRNERR